MPLPERLQAGDVVLRRPRAEDADAYLQAFRDDPELGRMLGLETEPTEPPDVDRPMLVVADRETDALLGEVTLYAHSERHRRAELALWLVPAARGRGVATRAVGALVDWGFAELDLLRVEMTAIPDNPTIPRLADRLGFTHECVMRKRNVERGVRVDVVWWGLLREEWGGIP